MHKPLKPHLRIRTLGGGSRSHTFLIDDGIHDGLLLRFHVVCEIKWKIRLTFNKGRDHPDELKTYI